MINYFLFILVSLITFISMAKSQPIIVSDSIEVGNTFVISNTDTALPINQIILDQPANVEIVNYPLTATVASDKTEFLNQAKEQLRLEHNIVGAKFRNGEIIQQEWIDYLNKIYNPKRDLLTHDILLQRLLLENSNKYTVDLNDLQKTIP